MSGINESVTFSADSEPPYSPPPLIYPYGAPGFEATVSGIHNSVTADGHDTYVGVDLKHALGTTIHEGADGVTLSIADFQSDLLAKFDISNLGWGSPAQTAAQEQPDGAGGTIIYASPASAGLAGYGISSVDFVGDPHVSASHFTLG